MLHWLDDELKQHTSTTWQLLGVCITEMLDDSAASSCAQACTHDDADVGITYEGLEYVAYNHLSRLTRWSRNITAPQPNDAQPGNYKQPRLEDGMDESAELEKVQINHHPVLHTLRKQICAQRSYATTDLLNRLEMALRTARSEPTYKHTEYSGGSVPMKDLTTFCQMTAELGGKYDGVETLVVTDTCQSKMCDLLEHAPTCVDGVLVQQRKGRTTILFRCYQRDDRIELPREHARRMKKMDTAERATWKTTWRVRVHVTGDTEESPDGRLLWATPKPGEAKGYVPSPRATKSDGTRTDEIILTDCSSHVIATNILRSGGTVARAIIVLATPADVLACTRTAKRSTPIRSIRRWRS